jgi:AhpC/TSA family.
MLPTRTTTGILALATLVLAAFTVPADKLSIGSTAPMTDAEMTDTEGEAHTLADAAKENGLLVMFTCNTCPWVKAWEDRYNDVAKAAAEHDIGMIGINPNAAIRDDGESMADMRARAKDKGYQFPYVLDEGAEMASAFGATKTPDLFLFNGDMELVYRGAIDDSPRDASAVEKRYILTAMEALANGQEIDPTTTKSIGCTIKFPES